MSRWWRPGLKLLTRSRCDETVGLASRHLAWRPIVTSSVNLCAKINVPAVSAISQGAGQCNDHGRQELEQQESIAFSETFHRIRRDLMVAEKNDEIAEALKWFDKVVMYNVPHGKRNRGMALVTSFRKLAAEDLLDAEHLEQARILGWCVELLQTFFLISDDIMDGSIKRRGQLCWYKQDGVGLLAINDGLYLESAVYQLLRLHFHDKPCYANFVDLFLDTTRKTVYGQAMDLLSTPPKTQLNLNRFTPERYANIIKYKTAYYSFSLPVRLAMYLAGITDKRTHRDAEAILLKMGHFFQVQDDYLDCYGSVDATGKIGTDIQDGKCAWPVVIALQSASKEQKDALQANYSRHEPEAVEKVKDIYRELGIERIYKEFEEQQHTEICKLIDESSKKSQLPSAIFYDFLSRIYRRNK